MRDKNTRAKLLASAKKEFLSFGYDKASLRRICKNAELTTGALYFFFDDKAALFEALAGNTAKELVEMLRDKTELVDIAFGKAIISYCYRHKDSVDLLFNCAVGSPYENFTDNIINILEEQNRKIIDHHVQKSSKLFNDSTIHWLAHVQTESILHILLHDFTEERALQQVEIVINFLIAGFDRISEMAIQED